MAELPAALLAEIDALVAIGDFPNREVAVAELVRLGLDALRSRRSPAPPRPPVPPGVGHVPGDDDSPIAVDPTQPRWMGRGPTGDSGDANRQA